VPLLIRFGTVENKFIIEGLKACGVSVLFSERCFAITGLFLIVCCLRRRSVPGCSSGGAIIAFMPHRYRGVSLTKAVFGFQHIGEHKSHHGHFASPICSNVKPCKSPRRSQPRLPSTLPRRTENCIRSSDLPRACAGIKIGFAKSNSADAMRRQTLRVHFRIELSQRNESGALRKPLLKFLAGATLYHRHRRSWSRA